MSQQKVAVRSEERFVTDEGRTIIIRTKKIEVMKEVDDDFEGSDQDVIYIGEAMILLPNGMPQQIMFSIDDAETLEEAVLKFDDAAQSAVEEMKQDMIEKHNRIQAANPMDMEMLNQLSQNSGIITDA